MTKMYNLKKAWLFVAGLFLFGSTAKATSYTAVASGNFSSTTTWAGGVVPTLTGGDDITVSNGVNLMLDQSLTLNNGDNLIVNGSVTGTNKSYLEMKGGSILSGIGNVEVDSFAANFTGATAYTLAGNFKANVFYSMNATINTASTINIDKTLYLKSGTMNINSGTVQMVQGSTIIVEDGVVTTGSGTLDLNSSYNVIYRSSANTAAGIELSGTALTDVTLDMGSNSAEVDLSNNVVIKGMLSLNTGVLDLNNNNLTLDGDVMSTNGSVKSSAGSDISITSNSSFTGMLKFQSGNNAVKDFTVNMGSAGLSAMIDGEMKVNSTLNLQQGKLDISSGTNGEIVLESGASVSGGSASSFVITGENGRLSIDVLTSGTQMFHVGTSAGYTPAEVTATANSGSSKFSVGVNGEVKEDGMTGTAVHTTQPMVAATWFIESSASSNIEADLKVMWDASMEVNSFDRTKAYISHYNNSEWDVETSQAATNVSGSMYSMTRAGVQSFSPFAVFDENTSVSVENIASDVNIGLYPNPANDVLNISVADNNKNLQAEIYNVSGQKVHTSAMTSATKSIDVANLPSGMYYIRLNGDDVNATQKFIKQ